MHALTRPGLVLATVFSLASHATAAENTEAVYYECFRPDGALAVKIYQSDKTAVAMAAGEPEPAQLSIDKGRKVFHFVEPDTGEVLPNKGFVILEADNSASYTVKKGGGIRVLAKNWKCQEKNWPASS